MLKDAIQINICRTLNAENVAVSKRKSYCCVIAKNVITIEKTYALVCKG
jgi:hypothetical protein